MAPASQLNRNGRRAARTRSTGTCSTPTMPRSSGWNRTAARRGSVLPRSRPGHRRSLMSDKPEALVVSPLLDSREVATYLKVSESTLSRWRSAGTGPPLLRHPRPSPVDRPDHQAPCHPLGDRAGRGGRARIFRPAPQLIDQGHGCVHDAAGVRHLHRRQVGAAWTRPPQARSTGAG